MYFLRKKRSGLLQTHRVNCFPYYTTIKGHTRFLTNAFCVKNKIYKELDEVLSYNWYIIITIMFLDLIFLHFLRYTYSCSDDYSANINRHITSEKFAIPSIQLFYLFTKLVLFLPVTMFFVSVISKYWLIIFTSAYVTLFYFFFLRFLLFFPALIGYYSKAACTTQVPWEAINLPVYEICSRRVCDKTRLPRGVGFHGGTLQHPPSPGIRPRYLLWKSHCGVWLKHQCYVNSQYCSNKGPTCDEKYGSRK